MIENLMLSLAADAEQYQRYWRGEECNEALLRRTLQELALLEPYFGSWELDASEALARVVNERAAMTVLGDWAMDEVDAEAVGTIPFPGTSQYFVFTADVFALSVIETANVHNGLAWLRSVTLKQTQREFSAAKIALPARVDVELASPLDVPRTWVRSLPAFLPYHADAPFLKLQNELASWLDSDDDGERLIRYAREQYPKLSHGTVRCEPPGDIEPTLVKRGAVQLREIEGLSVAQVRDRARQ